MLKKHFASHVFEITENYLTKITITIEIHHKKTKKKTKKTNKPTSTKKKTKKQKQNNNNKHKKNKKQKIHKSISRYNCMPFSK